MGGALGPERIRADLSQALPFRDGVFDLCYSVSAVHYLVQDSLTRSAQERVRALTQSLRRIRAPNARPCTLQAYLTRDSEAVQTFQEVARLDAFGTHLVVDQSHGQKAERDFLYLSEALDDAPPCRCALYEHATCALALETWARARSHPVRLDAAHRAWLVREHDRYARRILRLHKRAAAASSWENQAKQRPTRG